MPWGTPYKPSDASTGGSTDLTVMPATREAFDALPDAAKNKWVNVWATPGGPRMPDFLKGTKGKVTGDPAGEVKLASEDPALPSRWGTPYRPDAAPQPSALKRDIGMTAGSLGALAPMMAGAEMGGEIGALGGPVGAGIGGVLGAGVGGLASPTGEYLTRKALELPGQIPTYAEAGKNAVMGMASEMGAPIATKYIAEPLLNVGGKIWRALSGTSDIAKAATGAMEETEAANLKEKGKLQEAASKEALTQKKASLEAASRAGQAQMGDIEKRHGEILQAQQSAVETQRTAQAKADQNAIKVQQRLAKDIEPQARAEVTASTLPPPGPTAMGAGPDRVARRAQFNETAISPLQTMRAEWVQQRDALLHDHLTGTPDLSPVHGSASTELARSTFEGRARYSPPVANVLDEMEHYGKADQNVEGLVSDVIRGAKKIDPAVRDRMAQLMDREYDAMVAAQKIDPSKKVEIQPERLRALAEEALGYEKPEPKTVADLLSKQANINKMARGTTGADRVALENVSRGIDDALIDYVPTPELKALNAEYADHRAHFPYGYEDAIKLAQRPVDATQHIFDHPERVLDLVKFGTPETRANLAQLLADHVKENGAVPRADVVKALGLGGPLANPESWVYSDKAIDRLGEVLDSSPQAKAKYEALKTQADTQIKNNYANTVLSDARSSLAKLGASGKRIQAHIDSAPTLYEKAARASQALSGIQPGDAVSMAVTDVTGQGNMMGMAASGAAQNAPREARQALRAFQPKDPEQAAVEAVQKYEAPGGIMARWKRRAEFWAPLTVGTAATGRPSAYAAAGLAMGAPIAARDWLMSAFRQSLKDPANATEFVRALQNYGVPANLGVIAKYVAQAGLYPAIRSVEGDDARTPKTPVTKGPGPGVKAAETKRAEAIAGPKAPPAKVKTVKDTARKVTAGKTPNVHHDLETGKLSLGHVRKMIDAGGSPDLASLFQGLSPSDAIQVLAKANAQEKDLFLPAVAQKLNDSRGKVPPQEQQNLIAQLQRAVQSA